MTLKLVIDKKRKKILYGEADKTFVDFLFTILALPVGTVVKLLSTGDEGTPMLGSLGSLYRSAETLSLSYFEGNHHKNSLLKPELPPTTAHSQIGSLLQVKSSSPPKTNYYTCTTTNHGFETCRYRFSATRGAKCPECNISMTRQATYVYGAGEARPVVGGYVKGGIVTYMVMDDLTVKPMSSSSMSILSILNELNVEDVAQVDDKLIYLNVEDVCTFFFLS